MQYITILIFILLLTACQSTLIRTEQYYLSVSPESTIDILQPLEVFPLSARAYLQNGELIHPNGINLYQVDCEVEINTVSEQKQTIQPGRFNIVAIRQEESPIVMLESTRVASLNLAWFDDSPVDIKRYYYFKVHPTQANSNSEVRAVICRGVQSDPYQAELPTLDEMKMASGDFLKFNF